MSHPSSTASPATAGSDQPDDRPRRLALRYRPDASACREVRRKIVGHCDGRVSEPTLFAAQLIASELVANGIEHGGDGIVTIDLTVDDGTITMTVTSPGDPRRIPPLGTWFFPEDGDTTGRGLAFAQALAGAVELHNRWAYDEQGSWVGITTTISDASASTATPYT